MVVPAAGDLATFTGVVRHHGSRFLCLGLRSASHGQATNDAQVTSIQTIFHALERYLLPAFGVGLIVFRSFFFALMAISASEVLVGAHGHV